MAEFELPPRPDGATRVLLVRHGETSEEVRGRVYGSLDVPLSARGETQAQRLGAMLGPLTLDAVYSSPRRRAVDTARAFGEPTIIDALAELSFGDLEGRTYEEIARELPEFYREWMMHPTNVRFPGGENYRDLASRVLAAIADRRADHAGGVFAVVAHGGVVRAALAAALRMPDERIFSIGCDYASVSIVDWFGDTPVVALVNAAPRVMP